MQTNLEPLSGQLIIPKVIIACPTYKREWVLPSWFQAIENQTYPLDKIGFVFELGPEDEDPETHDILFNWHAEHPEVWCFDARVTEEQHESHVEGKRSWTSRHYHKMVRLRNNLLERVSVLQPDRYFSLDSDILLENPRTIELLVSFTEHLDAVSPLSYMFPRAQGHPNIMSWVYEVAGPARRKLNEYQFGSVFEVDIIMAAVMMSKNVYSNVRYEWHKQGEDLGWSAACATKGYRLWSVPIYAPHMMHRWMLDQYLQEGTDGRGNLVQGYENNGNVCYHI
jgi:hypothetical protein